MHIIANLIMMEASIRNIIFKIFNFKHFRSLTAKLEKTKSKYELRLKRMEQQILQSMLFPSQFGAAAAEATSNGTSAIQVKSWMDLGPSAEMRVLKTKNKKAKIGKKKLKRFF